MKIDKGAVLWIFFLCLIFIGLPQLFLWKQSKRAVKPNQIWVHYDTLNPFIPKVIDTIKVLEVKDGFAKVIWRGRETSFRTRTINVEGAQLIEKNEK